MCPTCAACMRDELTIDLDQEIRVDVTIHGVSRFEYTRRWSEADLERATRVTELGSIDEL